ncbi:MAG: hypothetical protein ACI33N_03080 [Desulfovibrionaceae bacterium]
MQFLINDGGVRSSPQGHLPPPLSSNGGLNMSNFLAVMFVAGLALFGLYITRRQS